MYVKPPPHIKAKHWSSQAEAVTGLTHYCDKITNAQSIVQVWEKFVEWCNNIVPDNMGRGIGIMKPNINHGSK
jgi:hypothetical protein